MESKAMAWSWSPISGSRPRTCVESPNVGGDFDSRAMLLSSTVLAAARRLGRPLKLVVPREAMFTIGSFRASTWTRVATGAQRSSGLTSIIFEESAESAATADVAFAFAGHRAYVRQRDVARRAIGRRDGPRHAGVQRAPAEASSFLGSESAIDELAVKLEVHPIETCIGNAPTVDPVTARN